MAGKDPDHRQEHLQKMRVEYGSVEKDGSPDLDADWLDDGWLALLRKWIGDAERLGVAEPNAMVLATVAAGKPVSRSVLCKSVDETGITFFTNYDSAKGDELAATPFASATFPWFQLGRQVHIRGAVTKVDPQVTEDYCPSGRAVRNWARGVASVRADRFALGAAGPAGGSDRALRRRRAHPGAPAWALSHHGRRGGILAGPGEPGAQPNSRNRFANRTPAALSLRWWRRNCAQSRLR